MEKETWIPKRIHDGVKMRATKMKREANFSWRAVFNYRFVGTESVVLENAYTRYTPRII